MQNYHDQKSTPVLIPKKPSSTLYRVTMQFPDAALVDRYIEVVPPTELGELLDCTEAEVLNIENLGSSPKRLFFDMDGTLAMFHSEANYLERMYEPGFFEGLSAYQNMLAAVAEITRDNPVVETYILSSVIDKNEAYLGAEKDVWLDHNLPEIPPHHRIYVPIGAPKAAFIPGGISECDYLIDDYNKNLTEWEKAGGTPIKCHNDINQLGKSGPLWEKRMVHTRDLPEMISAELLQYMGLPYDPQRVIDAYISPNHPAAIHSIKCNAMDHRAGNLLDKIRANYLSDVTTFYDNQLVEYSLPDGSKIAAPRWRCEAICNNHLGISHEMLADSSQETKARFISLLSAVQAQCQNVIHKNTPTPFTDRLTSAEKAADQRNADRTITTKDTIKQER